MGFVLEYSDAAEVYATLKCVCWVEVCSFRKLLEDYREIWKRKKEFENEKWALLASKYNEGAGRSFAT